MTGNPRHPRRPNGPPHRLRGICPRCGTAVAEGPDSLGRQTCPRCGHLWSRPAGRPAADKGTDEIGRKVAPGERRMPSDPASLPGADDLRHRLPGTDLGGYRVERFLGQGASGMVFLGRQVRLGRRVAIKVLSPRLACDQGFIHGLITEARILARINHPNILQVYDLSEMKDPGVFFMVMEWVDGCDLDVLVERGGGRLPVVPVLSIMRQAALGLAAAHQQDIIHRDIKPGNLMIGAGQVCKVTDFGLALAGGSSRRTPSGELRVGTAAFMSPEQSMQAVVDHRSDMYSLGCTTFLALTGHPPYDGDSPYAMILQHRTAPIPRLGAVLAGADPGVEELLVRLMAKRPQDRFIDMTQVADEIGILIDRLRVAGTSPEVTDSWLFGAPPATGGAAP